MKINLISITNNSEKHCEKSARICYDSENKITENSHENLLKHLIFSGHTSTLEHGSASFSVEGVSRACSHQLVRHRMISFSQQSQRYVNESNFQYITPQKISESQETNELYQETMSYLNNQYLKLIELGIKKEDARFVLPNSASTKLVMTSNFREWLHVIDIRVSQGAQWEIRNLFILVWKELYSHAPNIFAMQYFGSWSKDKVYKQEIFEKHIKSNS